jgi:hypothetical protein
MARVIYGAFITDIRGSMGGTTFQANKHGFTGRNKPSMKKPSGNDVSFIQSNLANVTHIWQSMTDAQRNVFDTFATTFPQYSKKNPTSQLSGYEVFLMWNCTRLAVGTNVSIAPSIVGLTLPSVAPTLVRSGGSLLFNLHEVSIDPDAAWGTYISPIVNGSINFIGSRTRFLRNWACSEGDVDITTLWSKLWGALPVAGNIVFVRQIPWGIISPFVYSALVSKITVT